MMVWSDRSGLKQQKKPKMTTATTSTASAGCTDGESDIFLASPKRFQEEDKENLTHRGDYPIEPLSPHHGAIITIPARPKATTSPHFFSEHFEDRFYDNRPNKEEEGAMLGHMCFFHTSNGSSSNPTTSPLPRGNSSFMTPPHGQNTSAVEPSTGWEAGRSALPHDTKADRGNHQTTIHPDNIRGSLTTVSQLSYTNGDIFDVRKTTSCSEKPRARIHQSPRKPLFSAAHREYKKGLSTVHEIPRPSPISTWLANTAAASDTSGSQN